ncbi:hypothetical protein GLW08_07145 [Pontibacillus yanchengensis]|uniref:Uncharacterized protein n=2 Tax=Pontibacillus yanchengensis TaxID=462910 RepID=A0A6I4ZXQ4_9BACI|nr:hypothetical protein [Pontibacillus yanchengensis]MYL32533.1 hypothetical protein [Pontibacillus yanchengensis]MYL53114.1 hypothetical protein [Pontibacillus yanchengensis]
MNMFIEYLLDLDLVNDPLLYSFYVSMFLSLALNRVWASFVSDASAWLTKGWGVEERDSFTFDSLQTNIGSTNHIINWIQKTIKKQEGSPDEDHSLIIQTITT